MKKFIVLVIAFNCYFGFSQVFEEPTDIQPLTVGENIPAVNIYSINNNKTSLPNIVKTQKTVLVFFRGGWCPYCNKHLSAVGEIQEDIKSLGYQIIAISPDSSEKLKQNIDKNSLDYELFSDSSTALIQAMGIAIKAPGRYTNMLLNYSENENSNVIPVPAVFIVNTNGEIIYSYTNPNYKKRLEESELLAALQRLN